MNKQNQKNKNVRLILGKELINTGKRPSVPVCQYQAKSCSFCNTENFILKNEDHILSLRLWSSNLLQLNHHLNSVDETLAQGFFSYRYLLNPCEIVLYGFVKGLDRRIYLNFPNSQKIKFCHLNISFLSNFLMRNWESQTYLSHLKFYLYLFMLLKYS